MLLKYSASPLLFLPNMCSGQWMNNGQWTMKVEQ